MSMQAKLFIILSKQTVSRTACQGGTGWCVRSVRAASNTSAWPPSLFSYLSSSLLLTHRHQALVTMGWVALQGIGEPEGHWRGLMSSFQNLVTFSSTSCFFFPAYSFHLRSTDQAWCSSSLSGICKCMCEYTLVLCGPMLHVCAFMSSMWRGGSVGCGGGCIWTLRSRLISLSHPQPRPASLGVSINNKSL